MTRGLEPRMVHLTEQALAALRGYTGPLSTPEIIAAVGLTPADSQAVWRALNWLVHHGLVERVVLPDSRTMHWQRTAAAAELEPTVDLEVLLRDNRQVDG